MKNINLSKEEVKAHDKFQTTIENAFNWLVKNAKVVLVAMIGVVGIFGGMTVFNHLNEKKELELQEKYYEAESGFLKKSETTNKPAAGAEPNKNENPASLDYSAELTILKELIEKHPSSQAAKMSGILLAEINKKTNKTEDTLKYLNLVTGFKSDTLSALFTHLKGQAFADTGDCGSAVKQWESNLNLKNAEFLIEETKLNLAICYKELNDLAKAESFLNDIKANAKANKVNVVKDAKKYLRLIQLTKKNI